MPSMSSTPQTSLAELAPTAAGGWLALGARSARSLECPKEMREPQPEPEPKPSHPGPKPTPWVSRTPSVSGVMVRRAARPPSIRRPLPASMTRIHLTQGSIAAVD